MDKSIRRWTWDERTGPEKIAARLNKRGWLWFKMPDAPEHAMQAPEQFVERVLSLQPKTIATIDMAPKAGSTIYAQHRAQFDFHTDIGTKVPYFPPRYIILVCVKQAPQGGLSFGLDSWELLSRIRKISPELYSKLLWVPRAQKFTPNVYFGPVYSSRFGNFISSCTSSEHVRDGLGILFGAAHAQGDKISYRMSEGDVTVIDNYRFFHGRTEFKGDRHLFRILVWPAEIQKQGPCHWAGEAEEAKEFFFRHLRDEGPLAQRAFGMVPYGDEIFPRFPSREAWERATKRLCLTLARLQKQVAKRI